MNGGESGGNYAHLPEDLIKQILDDVPATVDKMNGMFDIQDKPIKDGISHLAKKGFICDLAAGDDTDSLVAVDGAGILEKMSGTDLLLVAAIGVEGLLKDASRGWGEGRNQYKQWQTVLPHDEATPRLCQGAMFLMELGVLADSKHEIRIMDGSHFTPIIKVNSMLSATQDHAGEQYVGALREFLKKKHDKIIPEIPDIVKAAMNDERIIAIAKYSSSRDLLEAHVGDENITLDDKTFFTLGLGEDQYTAPMSVGQSKEERRKIWNQLHMKCNLQIPEQEELNAALAEAVAPLRTRKDNRPQQSSLFFTYYKPHKTGPAYRIECKNTLAENAPKFERMLRSVKRQIAHPDIREPFPQYLADLMAKSVSGGMTALHDAIRLSDNLNIRGAKFDLLLPYRSK